MSAPGKAYNTGPKPRGWGRIMVESLKEKAYKLDPSLYCDDNGLCSVIRKGNGERVAAGSTQVGAWQEAIEKLSNPTSG